MPRPLACTRAAGRTAPCTPRRQSSPCPRAFLCSLGSSAGTRSAPPPAPPPTPTRRRAAGRRAHAAVAAGFPRLLFENRQAREEMVDPPTRRLDPLAQRLVLLLQVRHPVPRLGVGLGGGPAPPTTLLQLGFGLDGTRAPPGQLVRHVAKDGLELVEHLRINSLSVVRQAHPPAPPAPAPTAHPRPARAASARDRGTSSAKPRRGAPPGYRAPDTRRTLRAARAAAHRPPQGLRGPGRR